MAEITMPRLSDTMSEGTVGRWLKKVGDAVQTGDILAEIETDKATMELEAFESGTFQKILIPEGQMVSIGTPIALVGNGAVEPEAAPSVPEPSAAASAPSANAAAPTEEGGSEAVAKTTAEARQQTDGAESVDMSVSAGSANDANGSTDGRILASPLARRVADEQGIDLRQVRGTGPGGRILKENVEEFGKQKPANQAPAAAAPAPAPVAPASAAPAPAKPSAAPALEGDEVTAMSRMRRAVARAMTESKPGIPHIYVSLEVDMGAAMQLRKQINESGATESKVSVNDLVVKAAAKALQKFPAINSSYTVGDDGQPAIAKHAQINVSVAVALEDGLIAPVVKDADKKSIGAVSTEIRGMAKRARDGKIKQNELEGATFQVSNLGMYDVTEFVSIITAPQAASIAVGAVRQVPVVRDGQIVVGEVMTVTISADHRIADGAVAAQYLQELKRLLQTPMSLLV